MPLPSRVLICGPLFAPDFRGGMPIAFNDVATELRTRGWSVDLAMTPEALGLSSDAPPVAPWASPRWRYVPRLRSLNPNLRIGLQHLLQRTARVQSALLTALERRLHASAPDVVIGFAAREHPGIAAFLTHYHPNVLLFSFDGLAAELRQARWLRAAGAVANLATPGLHPSVYRAVDPRAIRLAVFASESLRQDAVDAGVLEATTRTIYFGVRCPASLPDSRPPQGRLLWAGRCSPEKGLHFFLDALAALRRSRDVTLTAICAAGPDDYRESIHRQIARLNLASAVHILPAVPRDALASIYAAHDVLLFHSQFREPVALVLMEAFAAGIPVVAPEPAGRTMLVRSDETCVCFPSTAPDAMAHAIARALDDDVLRDRVRRTAHELVRSSFSIGAAGEAYDRALRELSETGARGAERKQA